MYFCNYKRELLLSHFLALYRTFQINKKQTCFLQYLLVCARAADVKDSRTIVREIMFLEIFPWVSMVGTYWAAQDDKAVIVSTGSLCYIVFSWTLRVLQ